MLARLISLAAQPLPSYDRGMLALRAAFTVAVMALVVWLLLDGRFGDAALVVILAAWLRRAVESGRPTRLAGRFARPS